MCTIFGDNIQARSIRGQPHLPPHTFLAAYIFLKFTSKKLTYHGVATPPPIRFWGSVNKEINSEIEVKKCYERLSIPSPPGFPWFSEISLFFFLPCQYFLGWGCYLALKAASSQKILTRQKNKKGKFFIWIIKKISLL